MPLNDEWVDTYGNFDAEDMNWGGDPKGQLATAIRKARIKAKEPKKPLKIEKLDAETSGQWEIGEQLEEAQMNAEDEKEECPSCLEVTFLDGDVCDDCTYCEYCEEYHPDEITQICYENAYHKHYDGPDTDHEDYREAEDKKRKKISGVLSDPFDEVSLDSGGIKKGIVALAAVGLTIFGIIKWK